MARRHVEAPAVEEGQGLVVDLFAGGGGASAGIEAALGRPVDVAINHDPVALAVHRANHPAARHLEADIWEVRPREATGGRPVDLLWASPDCTHFSVAKGDVPRKQNIRSLAWAVVRWARDVRPRVICLENVSEFRGWGPLGQDGRPDRARMGQTFRRWVGRLQGLGYTVDYRVLDASHYGAPTRRRRLFLVARCDGEPIRWPEPTHGPGRLSLHTAAECIDWSLPCPSIFERRRPLADKTLWRIAQGIKRFVLENPTPFVVRTDHHQSHATNAFGAGQPLGTITSANGHAVVAPVFATIDQQAEGARAVTAPSAPLRTTVVKNRHALIAPSLVKVNHGKREARGEDLGLPLSTVTATQRGHALVSPTLMTIGYGEREGQAARVPGMDKPLGTVVAGGGKHALVAAFVAKHFSERAGGFAGGQQLDLPMGTVTAKDHHSLAAATLVKLRGDCHGADLAAPLPTITAGGFHVGEVRAFLTAFYGSDGNAGKGQRVLDPLRTLTAKHRLGLVTIEGTAYQIVDIGMRMLEPHELLLAQFGRFAAAYDLSQARTKAAQVRLIGNSVCPEVAEAVVRANLSGTAARQNVA